MYDMTPLTRYEVAGPGAAAFLQRMTTNNVDKSVGSVTYTLLLDETGGIRSDITVARLAARPVPGRRQRAAGLRLAAAATCPDGVTVRDITGGTCCVGVWGPLARDLVAAAVPRRPVARDVQVLPRTCRPTSARSPSPCCGSPMSASWAGRSTLAPNTVPRCGICCSRPASAHEVIAAGRIAFNSLRIEKGYRLWGTDMTAEHLPAAAGVEFAVKMNKDDFIGKAALEQAAAPQKVLRSIVFDEPTAVALGKEPVYRR